MTASDFKATSEQWHFMEEWATDKGAAPSCMLELRARVEALEATQHAHADFSHLSEEELQQMRIQLTNQPGRVEALEAAQQPATAASPAPEPAPVATDEELWKLWHCAERPIKAFRAIYGLGRQHGAAQATCPHIVSSDEGTSYCRLAEQGARVTIPDSQMLHALRDALCDAISALRYIEQHHGRLHGVGWDRVYKSADPLLNAQAEQSAAPAPTGSLVERVAGRLSAACGLQGGQWDESAIDVIREVAAWLEARKNGDAHSVSVALLQREANQ